MERELCEEFLWQRYWPILYNQISSIRLSCDYKLPLFVTRRSPSKSRKYVLYLLSVFSKVNHAKSYYNN